MFGEGIYGFLTCVFLHGRGWVFCEFCRFSGRGALRHGWDGDSFFLSLSTARRRESGRGIFGWEPCRLLSLNPKYVLLRLVGRPT